MKASIAATPDSFDIEVETLIVGAGAAGLVAALAAREQGQEVLVIEADAVPAGSTALSAGLIPAAGTQQQRALGIMDDDPARFGGDIQSKAGGQNDPALVRRMCETAPQVIDWLTRVHALPLSLVSDFDYPGHSRRRLHGLPSRSGQALIDALRAANERLGNDVICKRRATVLFHDGARVSGIAAERPDGQVERIACQRLILACNGFGGNREMVRDHMPGISDALWFGHDGNRGDAITWGQALGARLHHLGAYQGHGNVAHPHGILISWATIMEGGIQVNADGRRFWNEAQGYSEAARQVLAQPGAMVWTIFNDRIAAVARQFADFRAAEAQGALRGARDVAQLAEATGVPADTLRQTFAALPVDGRDAFGRDFSTPVLAPPYYAVQVTGALFHTQGGLVVDPDTAQVMLQDGGRLDTLYACGGAACGVSGRDDSGYLSGNGLLSAVTLGYIAGRGAPARDAA